MVHTWTVESGHRNSVVGPSKQFVSSFLESFKRRQGSGVGPLHCIALDQQKAVGLVVNGRGPSYASHVVPGNSAGAR